MSVPRRDHTATLLQDGRVLIVAGYGRFATPQTSELYDPATGLFSLTGSTVYTHGQGSTATRLADGRVLVVGGTYAAQIAEVYDPSAGTFSTTGGPSTRCYHTATLLPDGRVLVAGGQDPGSRGMASAVAELYDPTTGAFQPTGSLIEARTGHRAVMLPSGKVWLVGGLQITAPGTGRHLFSTEIYDPSTGLFSAGPSLLGQQLTSLSPTLLTDGTVLVVGYTRYSQLFDPVANSITIGGSMAEPRGSGTSTLLPDGKVLVVGGYVATGPVTTSSAEVYDPAPRTFSAAAPMAAARQQHTATLLSDGRVLVVGGYNPSDQELASAELFSRGGNTNAGSNVGVAVDVELPDGGRTTVSLTFDDVTAPGNSTVSTSTNGPPASNGFKLGAPPVYYDITTTATFTGQVRVCLSWTEGQFANESHITLFHREDSTWVDITDPASRDTVNNVVCGLTASLSPFALMEVKYPFAGFFQPVDNTPMVNSVKAGAAVPVKFSLGGDLGVDIFAEGYPLSKLVQCDAVSVTDDVETTVTAGGSTLNYDALAGQYVYVWKTSAAWAGSCRLLVVKFNDGEEYFARFNMRR